MTTRLKFCSVTSNHLTAVAFDEAERKLHVIFGSGAEYRYDAPETARRALLAESNRVDRKVFGASVGALFNRAIRDKFKGERVVGGAPPLAAPTSTTLPAVTATGPSELELRLGSECQPEPTHAAQDFYDVAGDLLAGGERT